MVPMAAKQGMWPAPFPLPLGEGNAPKKPPRFVREGDLKPLGWFQKFPLLFSLSQQREGENRGPNTWRGQ